jgi:hypothetical protein
MSSLEGSPKGSSTRPKSASLFPTVDPLWTDFILVAFTTVLLGAAPLHAQGTASPAEPNAVFIPQARPGQPKKAMRLDAQLWLRQGSDGLHAKPGVGQQGYRAAGLRGRITDFEKWHERGDDP